MSYTTGTVLGHSELVYRGCELGLIMGESE